MKAKSLPLHTQIPLLAPSEKSGHSQDAIGVHLSVKSNQSTVVFHVEYKH